MKTVYYKRFSIAVILLHSIGNVAIAGGFYIPQKGSVGVGLANAGGVVRTNDASIVFFNPAGMTELQGPLAQSGIDTIYASVNINNKGSTARTPGTLGNRVPYPGSNGDPRELTPLLNLYFAYPLRNLNSWLGLAISAPFGLSLQYDDDWFGRYDSIFSELKTIDIAPSLAIRINEYLSIGAGVNIQYADAKLTSAVPNTLNPGGPTAATDGLSTLKGDDWSMGFNVGILYKLSRSTRIGLHFRSGIDHTLEGNLKIEDISGPLSRANGDFDTTADLNLPPLASIGIAHDIIPSLTLYGEVQWFGWDTFKEIRVMFANGMEDLVRPQEFRNTYAFSGGVEYRLTSKWTFRGGLQYDQTPTIDKFRHTSIPDGNLLFIGLGVSYKFAKQLSLDVGYFHAFFEQEDINLDHTFFPESPVSGNVNVKAETDVRVDTLSVSVRYQF